MKRLRRRDILAALFIIALSAVLIARYVYQGQSYIRPLSAFAEPLGLQALEQDGDGALAFVYRARSSARMEAMEAWVEIYHYGELMESFPLLTTLDPGFANLLVKLEEHPDYSWHMSEWNRNGGSFFSADNPPYPSHGAQTRAFSALDRRTVIRSGREIALYAGAFSTDAGADLVVRPPQKYISDPQRIAEAEYLHLIKIRFD